MPKPKHSPFDHLDPDEFAAMVSAAHPEFSAAYTYLSRFGKCDSFGGMESRRVYHEWLEAECPVGLAKFIAVRANVGAIQWPA